MMWNNWQYRALALLMALVCWYVVSGQEKVETWLDVPLEFVNLPVQMEVTSGLVSKIQVRIRGTSNQVRSLNASRLAYKLDLGRIQPGTNIIPLVPEGMAITASAVEVVEISPSRLELSSDVMVSKSVPVRLDWEGSPGDDMQFKNATVAPDLVTITGFASALETVHSVSTARIQIAPDGAATSSGRVRLVLPKDVRATVSSVSYDMNFALIAQELWVKMNLEPVEHKTYSFTFDPKYVRVRLDMPVRLLRNKDWRDTLHMTLDPGAMPGPGQHMVRPLPLVPDGVVILETKPETVAVTVQMNAGAIP